MIIYSVMPIERIFANTDHEPLEYQETEVNGVKMVVEPTPQRYEAKIVRLLSSDPQDFLDPKYTPGQTIHFRPDHT
jgi:hypothetical protein